MNVTTGGQIVIAARPKGKPQLSDFRLEEVRIPEPGTGQVLLGVLYLSLDPYKRGCMDDESSDITGTELFVDGGFAQV